MFFFSRYGAHRHLHSFPTRRSSDLSASERRKVIINEDASGPGGSNLQTVALLVQSPQVEVLGITVVRSEEHTSELQSLTNLVCRLLLEKKKTPAGMSADRLSWLPS